MIAKPGETEVDGPLLNIGAFARRSWLSLKALRLYDRLGVLVPAHVDRETGYRRYRESQLETARLIVLLRRLEMPLAQAAEVLAADGPRRAELVATFWETVERRIASQRELAAHLEIQLRGEQRRSYEMFEIREREVPEQLVLTEQRHVLVNELPSWIGEAGMRLLGAAGELGGQAAPMLVIYHGEVGPDSDGPVEVCVPIRPQAVPATVATRIEPAHREAYVRLRKAQVAYPQITSAYDAVSQWVSDQGLAHTAAPREVYFTDWDAAGPAEEVCDVAYPIP